MGIWWGSDNALMPPRNRKAAEYLDEIRQVFPDAVRKGTTIIATKPSK